MFSSKNNCKFIKLDFKDAIPRFLIGRNASTPPPTLIIQHVISKHVIDFPAAGIVLFTRHSDETQGFGCVFENFNHLIIVHYYYYFAIVCVRKK